MKPRAAGWLLLLFLPLASARAAETPKTFRVAWSHYTGWEPWGYAEKSGILKKWADKNRIEVTIERLDDYMESIAQYSAGKFDACAMTNMDALAIPAVGGVDSTALIVGDFSNGNDGVLLKKGTSLQDLKGRPVHLVELSVSHYLLDRALSMAHMNPADLALQNATEAEIEGAFAKEPNAAVVTWNPILLRLRSTPGARVVFDSSKIPGEIIDLMVVRTSAPDSLKKTLVGAWYEVMAAMSVKGAKGDPVLNALAEGSACSRKEYEAQLATTAMFYTAAEAAAFARDPKLKATMEYVRTFSFDHGLYGEGAKSKDLVGIAFPDGTVLGNKSNVKLRFDDRYMAQAAP
jgi:NitT/TauT family transport system substrate-binding protein